MTIESREHSGNGNGRGRHEPGSFAWPDGDLTRMPDWVYTSDEIYRREVERIFEGPTWNYVALEAEIPNPGDFVRSSVAETQVIVTRGTDGGIHVVQNRCSHRGAEFCRTPRGHAKTLVCPYHQWTYDLTGKLIGVPFRRGLKGQGGYPQDFKPENHGLPALNVTTRGGAIFASFAKDMPSIEDYLGTEMLEVYDTVFSGRKLRIHGYYRNSIPGNWKLYHENLKDPYHATLLHVYLVTFGLMRAGANASMMVDPSGRHGAMGATRGSAPVSADAAKQMGRAFIDSLKLSDERILDFVPEFREPWTVTMQTFWPNLIIQRELNTLGVRQIVPRGPHAFDLYWTMFGYEDDDDEMTRHRLRQANLMGPAGFLGIEDSEAIEYVQDGLRRTRDGVAVTELGGREEGTAKHLITEAAIRSMYRHWREVIGV